MKIIIAGNPANGYKYYGPFADSHATVKYGQAALGNEIRMIVDLQPVSDAAEQPASEAERLYLALGDVVVILSTQGQAGAARALGCAKKALAREALPQTIVIAGDPISGFEYFGPFNGGGAAEQWSTAHCFKVPYWLATLIRTQESQP
jgi:hypothetical protein